MIRLTLTNEDARRLRRHSRTPDIVCSRVHAGRLTSASLARTSFGRIHLAPDSIRFQPHPALRYRAMAVSHSDMNPQALADAVLSFYATARGMTLAAEGRGIDRLRAIGGAGAIGGQATPQRRRNPPADRRRPATAKPVPTGLVSRPGGAGRFAAQPAVRRPAGTSQLDIPGRGRIRGRAGAGGERHAIAELRRSAGPGSPAAISDHSARRWCFADGQSGSRHFIVYSARRRAARKTSGARRSFGQRRAICSLPDASAQSGLRARPAYSPT